MQSGMHVGWQRLRAAFRRAGVAPTLFGSNFRERLGARARLCPTRYSLFELLDRHLSRDNLAEGRYVSYRIGESARAHGIVTRVRGAAPELGPVTLVRDGDMMELRMIGAHAHVGHEHVDLEALGDREESSYLRYSVTVDGLLEASNRLLAMRGLPYRFLPMDTPDDVRAFLGVDIPTAVTLDQVDTWDGRLDELDGFAHWAARAA